MPILIVYVCIRRLRKRRYKGIWYRDGSDVWLPFPSIGGNITTGKKPEGYTFSKFRPQPSPNIVRRRSSLCVLRRVAKSGFQIPTNKS